MKRKMFHPGYYVNEIMSDMGIDEKELAEKLQMSKYDIVKILKDKRPLTTEFISKFALFTHTSEELWENLQKTYNLLKEREER